MQKIICIFLMLSACATTGSKNTLQEREGQKNAGDSRFHGNDGNNRITKNGRITRNNRNRNTGNNKNRMARNSWNATKVTNKRANSPSANPQLATRKPVAADSAWTCTQYYQNEFSPGLLVLNTQCDPNDRLCIALTQTIYNSCDTQVHKKLIRPVCNCEIRAGSNSCQPTQEPLFLENEILCDKYCDSDVCVR